MDSKTFVNFSKPQNYSLKVYIWLLIIVLNVIINLLEEPLAALGYRSWAFWLVNISFFLMEHEETKTRIIKICVGACTGCILAYFTILLYATVLAPIMGHIGLLIPIAVALALVVLAGPFFPAFFNSVTFMYFLCSTIVASEAVSNVWTNCAWAIAGSLIINCSVVAIVKKYTKAKMTKAAAASAAANK